MKIVVEYVLLENLLINLITLKTTALLVKDKGRFFFLSALVGACLCVALPIFRLSSFGYVLVEAGLVILFVCISFKFSTIKKFVQIYLSYFVATLLYGGACFFFEGLFGIESTLIVLVIVSMTYFVVKFLFKRYSRKKSVDNFCFDIEILCEGKTTKWKAFLDSGNLLFDPLTQSPVSLVNFRVFSKLFDTISVEDILRKSDKLKNLKLAHFIAFNTLNANDKILVFQVDEIKLNGKVQKDAVLGLSLKNFNQAFGTDIILHNNFACV